MKTLAVIPARGGSKSVPQKNIRILGEKPLIVHTIETSNASKRISRTIVSTDDEKIASIARSFGADVPFVRPAELATDDANAIDVIKHALIEVEKSKSNVEYNAVVMLQPTSPFRLVNDIDDALKLLEKSEADSVISVVAVNGYHPARMKYLDEDRLIDPSFVEAYENQPRQELKPIFIRNGAIYATRRDVLLNGSFKGRDSRAWIMPFNRSINIDTEMDFRFAEWLLKEKFI